MIRIVDDERHHGAAVVLTLRVGRHGNLPEQFAGGAVKRQEVGIVSNKEDLIAQNSNSAVGAEFRIAAHTGTGRTRDNAREDCR